MAQNTLLSPVTENERKPEIEQTYSPDGVDLTLIRWMLSLTPAERLHVLQQSVESLLSLLDASANR